MDAQLSLLTAFASTPPLLVGLSRICEWCDLPYTPQGQDNGDRQRFCSDKCRDAEAWERRKARAEGAPGKIDALLHALRTEAPGEEEEAERRLRA